MPKVSQSASATREKVHLDLRPLHGALARASSVLDVLGVCEATAMVHGGGLWVAACVWPEPHTYVCGAGPLPDALLHKIVSDMEHVGQGMLSSHGRRLSRAITARWRPADQPTAQVVPGAYAQVDICATEWYCGVLRVVSTAAHQSESCDWDGVEAIMCAAVPHIVLCLQRKAAGQVRDPLTGLLGLDEFNDLVEREVRRAELHPCELALLLMELRLGPGRRPGVMTDTELRAVGEVIRATIRSSDSACLTAEGHFAVLMPLTSQRNALIAAARITDRLRAHPHLPSDLECRAGVSGWTFEGATAPELFEQARCALEGAKCAGAKGAFLFL